MPEEPSPSRRKSAFFEPAARVSRALYPAVVLALNTGLRSCELTGRAGGRSISPPADSSWGSPRPRQAGAGLSRSTIEPWRPSECGPSGFWSASRRTSSSPRRSTAKAAQSTRQTRRSPSAASRKPGKLRRDGAPTKRRVSPPSSVAGTTCDTRSARGSSKGLPILAALMGWSAATTVRMAKRYGHIAAEVLSEAVAGLGAPLFEGKGAQKGAQSQSDLAAPFPN
jgi:hypothetical protein